MGSPVLKVVDIGIFPRHSRCCCSGVHTCALVSKFGAAWSMASAGSSSLQKRLRVVILQQFLSSLCDIFCLAVCSPLMFMPWSWTSIPPLLQHYRSRHIRPGGENACETWRSPMLLLLLTSAAEAVLLCLCIVCLACPWHWRRIASMLSQDGSRRDKRLVLLSAIVESVLDLVSLPIALVALVLAPWNASSFLRSRSAVGVGSGPVDKEGFHGNSEHIFWLHSSSDEGHQEFPAAPFHTNDTSYCLNNRLLSLEMQISSHKCMGHSSAAGASISLSQRIESALERSLERAYISASFLALALRDYIILLLSFICLVSVWRTLPFLRTFTRRVSPALSPTKEQPPNNSLGASIKSSKSECLFSHATLMHALEQLFLLFRDVVVGLPAFLLAVASLVRLPSLIANVASACITRQISPCEPVARIRVFNLVVPPTTDYIMLRIAGTKASGGAHIRALSMHIVGSDLFDRVQEVWGQAAASLLQVTLPVQLQLPDQHTLNSSCDFDITCKLAFKSKVAVVLRSLQQMEKCSASNGKFPVQFCLQVHATYLDGSSAVLSAALVSTSQIYNSIRDGGDGSLLPQSISSIKHNAFDAASSESAVRVAVSSTISQLERLRAPDAHPDATNQLLAFIGVPIPTDASVAAVNRVATTASHSDVPPNQLFPPLFPLRQRPIDSTRHSGDATKLSLEVESGDQIDDFAQRVLPFLKMQQDVQDQRRQCVQDSIFYISVMEAAIFLKHVAILCAFLVGCCLVPWRLPAILRLVFKTNDTIKRFQALNVYRLLSLIASQRPDMIAISLQRMHSGIRRTGKENFGNYDLHQLASHVTGCGRVQSVYERLLSKVCYVLKNTDADGHGIALWLVKAHDDSMRLLQLYALHYVYSLHDLTISAKHSAKAADVSATFRGIRHPLPRSRATLRATLGSAGTQSVLFSAGSEQPAVTVPSHARKFDDFSPVAVATATGANVIEPSRFSDSQVEQLEEVHRLDSAGVTASPQLVLDNATLNHIDQQARVATIVAAHFAYSEATFVAALQKIRDRELQLQDDHSSSKWAPSHAMKNMQNLVMIMLTWLLQDALFAFAACLVGVTFYRIRFVWSESRALRSFVCVRELVMYQSVEVLSDALALLRAMALLISVYKSFDVFGDIFISRNGTSASHLRSIIAKHFHELLLDCLWLLRPLWSFDWYRYITAVAAYLLLIPVEMLAQILSSSHLVPTAGSKPSVNLLPLPQARSQHYIVAFILWTCLFAFPFVFIFYIISSNQNNLDQSVTASVAAHLVLVVAIGWLCIWRASRDPFNLHIVDGSFSLHFSLANTEAICSIITDTFQICILLLVSVSNEVAAASSSLTSAINTLGSIFNLQFYSISFEIMFWITVAGVAVWILVVSAPILFEDVLQKREVGTISKLPIWRSAVSFFCTTLFVPIVNNLLQPLRCNFVTPLIFVLNAQPEVPCWQLDVSAAPLLSISQARLALLAMVLLAFFTLSTQAVSVTNKFYGNKESPTLDIRYPPVYLMVLQSTKLCVVVSQVVFAAHRRVFLGITLALSLLALSITAAFKALTRQRACSITMVTGLRCLSFSFMAWTAIAALVVEMHPEFSASYSVLTTVALPGWIVLCVAFLIFAAVERQRSIVHMRQLEEQLQVASTRAAFLKAYAKCQSVEAFLPSWCNAARQRQWAHRVASARRLATFHELLHELEDGIRLDAVSLTFTACRRSHLALHYADTPIYNGSHEALRAAAETLYLHIISECNRFRPPAELLFIRNLLEMNKVSFKRAACLTASQAHNLMKGRFAGGGVQNSNFSNEMFPGALLSAAQEVQPIGVDAMATLIRRTSTGAASSSTLPQAFSTEFSPIPVIASVPESHREAQV